MLNEIRKVLRLGLGGLRAEAPFQGSAQKKKQRQEERRLAGVGPESGNGWRRTGQTGGLGVDGGGFEACFSK